VDDEVTASDAPCLGTTGHEWQRRIHPNDRARANFYRFGALGIFNQHRPESRGLILRSGEHAAAVRAEDRARNRSGQHAAVVRAEDRRITAPVWPSKVAKNLSSSEAVSPRQPSALKTALLTGPQRGGAADRGSWLDHQAEGCRGSGDADLPGASDVGRSLLGVARQLSTEESERDQLAAALRVRLAKPGHRDAQLIAVTSLRGSKMFHTELSSDTAQLRNAKSGLKQIYLLCGSQMLRFPTLLPRGKPSTFDA
jgi:hypothetical protein